MKSKFELLLDRATDQRDYWTAWLDGFIAAEVTALVALVTYCLVQTF